ncbi:hypothetical protein EBH_0083830 [Eimeria brunetti]|uniref:Uncharacterized protein n=1 Tax=Eimeria brunetti TaxID=51314 RepID=U6M010_9EIME|nr:hypothetical protein EBH_0083830 [Eimeria brunetti]
MRPSVGSIQQGVDVFVGVDGYLFQEAETKPETVGRQDMTCSSCSVWALCRWVGRFVGLGLQLHVLEGHLSPCVKTSAPSVVSCMATRIGGECLGVDGRVLMCDSDEFGLPVAAGGRCFCLLGGHVNVDGVWGTVMDTSDVCMDWAWDAAACNWVGIVLRNAFLAIGTVGRKVYIAVGVVGVGWDGVVVSGKGAIGSHGGWSKGVGKGDDGLVGPLQFVRTFAYWKGT